MRDRVEARLDALVRAHRVTIAVVVPVVGAVLLLASAAGRLPAVLAFNPLLVLAGVLAMRLPLVAGLAPAVDRRAGLAVAALATYAYAVEAVGVQTGLPYGEFHYGVDLGPMVGGVPLALPVLFVPLVANAWLLALLLRPDAGALGRLPLAAALVLLVDAVLDPAAVALGFWSYAASGAYYGVPATNFAGWVLAAAVGVLALDAGFDRAAVRARLADCPYLLDDLVSFTLLWGAVNVAFGQWVPVALTAALVLALVRLGRFDLLATGRARPAA